MVPTLGLPPFTPSTDQVIAGFVCPVTVAVNCCVAPAAITAVVGFIDMPLTTVTWAVAFLLASAALVAVRVWVPGWAGAVYKPVASIVPAVEFPPAIPSADQFTVVLLVPWTVALNCCCPPADKVTAL